MITTVAPSTWQDLQNQVARILSECGLTVETERRIKTVRGEVEIDVYAEESVRGRKYIILCECKYWRSPVRQNVIHGFRTVVGDTGAHKGYIISTRGFQRGSLSAADLTNIELVTWEKFQEAFEESWLTSYFAPLLLKRLNSLMTFAEGFAPPWFAESPEEEKAKYIALLEKYVSFGWFAQHLAMHPQTRSKIPYPKLPFVNSLGDEYDLSNVPDQITKAEGYREAL
jgi:restriction system protein